MSFPAVAFGLSWLLLAEAALLVPLIAFALAVGEGPMVLAGLAAVLLTGFVGAALVLSTRGVALRFGKHEAYLLIVLAWPVLALFGTLPWLLAPLGISALDAFFSTMSALTTTGAWVLPPPSQLPRTALLWFGLLQWGGGLLTVVFAVALMTYLGIGGLDLFRSALPRGEGTAPLQRFWHAARDLGGVYVAITLGGTMLLWLSGLSAFDALCHAFGAISTGGFTTFDGGVASMDNWSGETVLMALMLVGTLNFTTVWAVGIGRVRALERDPELRYLLALVAIVGVAILAPLLGEGWHGLGSRLHASLFAAISAISTTGYTIQAPTVWHDHAPVLLIALLLLGGCAGSTAGGLKLMRLAILFKHSYRELVRLSHPHGVVPMRFGTARIGESTLGAVWSFFFFGLLAVVGVALALAASGLRPEAALAGAVAAIANAGPALTMISPHELTYESWPASAKLVYTVGMVLGRVEVLTLLTLLNPAYWRH